MGFYRCDKCKAVIGELHIIYKYDYVANCLYCGCNDDDLLSGPFLEVHEKQEITKNFFNKIIDRKEKDE